MYKVLLAISRFMSSYTPWVVIAAAVAAFLCPPLFGWVAGPVQTGILGFIMLTMGLTLTRADMHSLVSRPLDLLIGACAQYGLMPLIAWSMVQVFHLDTALAVGILLVGCCPGGVSSNIMSYLCHGDVAYSVGMTTVSTLLAPLVTPALVLWLAGQSVEVDAIGMFVNILIVTVIPVGTGFACNVLLGSREGYRHVQTVMPAFSVAGLACIVGGVVSAVHDHLIAGGLMLLLTTFAVVFCHNTLGYLAGWLVGRLCRFGTAKKRTLSIEVGMQNAGLATNLSSAFFMATCPLAVVPCAISCAWHSLSGTLLATFFARRDKRATRKIRFNPPTESSKRIIKTRHRHEP